MGFSLQNLRLGVLVLLCFLLINSCGKQSQDSSETNGPIVPPLISFWDNQRKGTNHFNRIPSKEWFDAAKEANIQFVRLVYEKWEGEKRDYLLGDADNFQGIVQSDFQKLLSFLDYADSLEIKIVITPISLPGDRWVQSNDGKKDGRIWKDWTYRKPVIQYWKELAAALQGHPSIVGYNLVNEPHPERYYQKHDFWKRDLPDWYQGVKGGPGDLNLFNQQLVEAIRSIDPDTPIIIESGLYATPWAFDYLQPIEDDKIIYSFHMYEPYNFVTKRLNQGRYVYPGKIPIEGVEDAFSLGKEGLTQFFLPVQEWTARYNIPSNRIWVSEFGCDRNLEGAELYLRDLIRIFNENQWHWSFYSFREDDGFQAMDYELGKQKVHYSYWEYQEAGTMHLHYGEIYDRVSDSFWEMFQKEFVEP